MKTVQSKQPDNHLPAQTPVDLIWHKERTKNDLHHRKISRQTRARRRVGQDFEKLTKATNAEEGCLFFEWSRSLAEPNTYVLIEAFRDDEAGAAHVQTDHFKEATENLPAYLSETPDIINVKVDGWSKLGELAVTS